MYGWRSLILLTSSFLCILSTPAHAAAVPPIDVSLQASFPAPPFVTELLESAAFENSSAYFPLLNSIASGKFHAAGLSDADLYRTFERVLRDDGFITDEAALASWKFSLGIRASAPRIEAQFQYWRTSVEDALTTAKEGPEKEQRALEVWARGERKCSDLACTVSMRKPSTRSNSSVHHSSRELQFDHTYGDQSKTPLYTVYVDLSSPDFPIAWREWTNAHAGDSFRLRYKSPERSDYQTLVVNGYGAELALKRTDYIVIDDRESKNNTAEGESSKSSDISLEDEEISDVKPLSNTELRNLGLRTGSFVMEQPNPFEVLSKVSEDFPKHASSLAQHNVSDRFLSEHQSNREILLPAGYNIMWLNGQQVNPREIDAFNLLHTMRRERRLINSIQSLGLLPQDAISLLSHPSLAETQGKGEPQRYDFRDDHEGSNVIVWLNDIEKDTRYAEWPDELTDFLQRMYPGQLPAVRRDTHNVIFPIDFTDRHDVAEVVDTLQAFVKRLVPVRFGLVPIVRGDGTSEQSKVVYYLIRNYGLAAMLKYLSKSVSASKLSQPDITIFESVLENGRLRPNASAKLLSDVLVSGDLQEQVNAAQRYLARLGANARNGPLFCNGVAIPYSENWMQEMSMRVSMDLRTIQRSVFEGTITDDTWLPSLFLKTAFASRNPFLIPEDDKDVKLFDLPLLELEHAEVWSNLMPFRISDDVSQSERASLMVMTDLNEAYGAHLALNATRFATGHAEVEIRIIHSPRRDSSNTHVAEAPTSLVRLRDVLSAYTTDLSEYDREAVERYLTQTLASQIQEMDPEDAAYDRILATLNVPRGESAVFVNGRAVGPLPSGMTLSQSDFETLLDFERSKRLDPTLKAVKTLKLSGKLQKPLAISHLSSIVALSAISDVPEGIFDMTPGPRVETLNEWKCSSTCITFGDKETAVFQFVASIDPTSQVAQRWIPILRTLSHLSGVHLRIFLNPKDKLEELSIKRFYRHVLHAEPQFDSAGSMLSRGAQFTSIPQDVLLTLALDVPPSWLVAPKSSVYDLDNIRMSSVGDEAGIQAIYELEHILIEGHSRETVAGKPPRGAQLVLGTENDPEYAGTIIMANLGYFQFKASPGIYSLDLQKGASQEVFSIDSAGTMGYSPQEGDNTTDLSMIDFKGATMFPRLSRKAGQEQTDVLEPASSKAEDIASAGAAATDELFYKLGMPNVRAGDYIRKSFSFGQKVLSRLQFGANQVETHKHADINIFSVASGHLYERMMNIMILSVMRHTQHSVKFWFIEQFLSPSFKSFLPTMAVEYGFEYEMVMFKWPHWLRAQTEKQRMIWGYKILFLDVLFPLDLDKVIFVDADQIVRTDMYDLVQHDLEGAPYGFTPMCDSRTEMEGFRFWKQGYWANFLRGKPYHISALYVVDLKRFRAMAAGDRMRQQYQSLSADPGSLSNLDQDLPNHMQAMLPIHSLPQEWLWCETWCSDEALKEARTIDLCNNPMTKEPKLDRARRQVPEWTLYDDEIAALAKRRGSGTVVGQETPKIGAVKSANSTGKKEEL